MRALRAIFRLVCPHVPSVKRMAGRKITWECLTCGKEWTT